MTKVIRCADVGMKCDFVARGETEQEVLNKAAEHAGATHNMKSIPPEVLAKVRAAVRDE
jgi:predicted small metal-binding protein